MKKYILLIVAIVTFGACNNSFLERAPINSQTEGTAFVTYSNFQTYAWSLYSVFIKTALGSYGIDKYYYRARGDHRAGYLSSKDVSSSNPYAFNNVSIPSTDAGWNFEEVRRANIMLDNIEQGEISELQKAHWRGVGRFFRAYNYVELVARYGDVPWLDRAAQSENDDEIVYAGRDSRVVVSDNIVDDLLYAIANIDNAKDGDNTINKDCAKALLSRFALFEGTWRQNHGVDDSNAKYKMADLLQKSADVSLELINAYPNMHPHFNGKYLELESGTQTPGIILAKEFVKGVTMHSISRYEGTSYNGYEGHQAMIDMYLCSDGKTISNSTKYAGAKKSIYHEFHDRDARLLLSFIPPYCLKAESEARGIFFSPPADMKINPLEYQSVLKELTPNEKWMQIPARNWNYNLIIHSSPNVQGIAHVSRKSWSGYTFSRHTTYEDDNNLGVQASDKPIFFIEEIMLNYAEAMYELGRFDQTVADLAINPLRKRASVADMTVSDINDAFDPKRDPSVAPILWEIRRERMVELLGEGFGFNDIRRWKRANWFIDRPVMGFYMRHSDHSSDAAKTTVHPSYKKILLTLDGNKTNANITEGYVFRFADPTTLGRGWKDAYYLYAIPRTELRLNNKLKQNPGWDKL